MAKLPDLFLLFDQDNVEKTEIFFKQLTMFWDTIGLDYIVEGIELKKKLAKPDVTLSEILEDINCFQEIRNKNPYVLAYFKNETIFCEMIQAVLCPKIVDFPFDKNIYKFSHQCCEALSLAAHDFYQEFIQNPFLVQLLINFLQNDNGNLNHLNVSFYTKLVINFLIADTFSFLPILEESVFFESCIDNLDFCSIFELLCSIANCFPESSYKNRVKQWYFKKGFTSRLLKLLVADKPSEIHENAAALWVEFVKALRDTQFNEEQNKDELLESLQSVESIKQLLIQMFPNNSLFSCLSVVANGCNILNVLLEANNITDSPAAFFNHQIIELCCDYLEKIVLLIINLLSKNEDTNDALIGCMQVVVNLLNTNFLTTHRKFAHVFQAEKTHFKHIINFIDSSCSNFSIFNSYVTTFVFYILYSTADNENPLTDFLISEYNLPQVILKAVEGEDNKMNKFKNITVSNVDRLPKLAKKTFFLQLANQLVQCQLKSSQSEHIKLLMKGIQGYDNWLVFSECLVNLFANRNKLDQVLLNATRSSNSIEIDEIRNISFCMDNVNTHISADLQNNKVADLPISLHRFENLSLGVQRISSCADLNADIDNFFSINEGRAQSETFFADFAFAFGESSSSPENISVDQCNNKS